MVERTRISAGDDRGKAVSRVESLLNRLSNKTAFDALGAPQRQEAMREALVLILRITARRLLK